MQCFLPSEDETQIVVNFADGQKSITIDAVDIDNIVLDISRNKLPEGTSFESEFARQFYARYNRRLGPTAANMLCQVKHKVFESVKKNLFGPEEQSGTSEPEPASTKES